jgi:hypothetical protein
VGFVITDELLIRFSALSDTEEEMGVQWDSTSAINRLQESLRFSRRDIVYTILIEFGLPMTLVRLLKICLNESYIGKRLSDNFPIQSGLKQGDALLSLLFNFA